MVVILGWIIFDFLEMFVILMVVLFRLKFMKFFLVKVLVVRMVLAVKELVLVLLESFVIFL